MNRRFAALATIALLAPAIALAGFASTDTYVPSLGHWPGANGSFWYATIWVHNPNTSAANVQFFMLKRDQANPAPEVYNDTIPAGDTRRYDDAILTMFGHDAVGAVRVVADRIVMVNARSYSKPQGGGARDTVGQFYAAVPASFAVAQGGWTRLLGVYQTKSDSEFRYNFGFVETTGQPATVRVEALDGTGAVVGSKDYQLGGREARQYNMTDLLPGIDATNLALRVGVVGGSGRIVAFGSGIANRSNDPSTFEMSFSESLLGGGSGGDITSVTAGAGLTGGGTAGDVTLAIGNEAVTGGMIASGAIGKTELAAGGGTSGQVLGTDGTNLVWQAPASGGFALPYTGIGSTTGDLFFLNNTGSGRGITVVAASDTAMWANSTDGLGADLRSKTHHGVNAVSGAADRAGVLATNSNAGGVAVHGRNSASGNFGYLGTGSAGVDGEGGVGVRGASSANNGVGVLGVASNGANAYGIYGISTTGYAGMFNGKVHVNGTLSKSAGSFKIDHPLDPENKVLYHSFVESPDMMNIYNGVVVLDESGQATVELPSWFEALNRDFRYQLTCIGGFAPVFVAEKITGNRFRIGGGTAGLEVSWQVTGVRHDAFAERNRIPVEEDKTEGERGRYLNPDAFGMPESLQLGPVSGN